MPLPRKQVPALIALCLLLVGSMPWARSQATARISQTIDNTVRMVVPGSVHPAVKRATDLGQLSPSEPLARMLLVLKPSEPQKSALGSMLQEQQRKSSDSYHHWLTAAQFAAQFSAAPSDVQQVVAWLQQQGFTNVKPATGGQWIEFSGNANLVQSAFQTSMHRYRLATGNGVEEHIANATQISIPQALSPVVAGVLSLNNFFSKPLHTSFEIAKRNAQGKLARVKPMLTAGDGSGDFYYYLAPGDAQTIYGANPVIANGIDGTGVSIGIIGRNDIELSDVQTFRSLFGLPQNDPNFIVNGPDPGFVSLNDQVESSLDVEWAASVAPKATVNFVVAASTDTTDGNSLAAVYAVENNVAPILSLSYGACEADLGPAGNLFWNAVWEQAAAEGISVFVATGDSGAAQCDGDVGNSGPAVDGDTVNGLASTPYNVAVGGTQFAEGALAGQYWNTNNNANFESALGYIPEAVWNDSCDPTLPSLYGNCPYGESNYNIEGGGGGKSNCSQGTVDPSGNVTCTGGYPKPTWQTGPGVPADGVRDVPDVALNASPEDDPYILCALASCQFTGSGSSTTISTVGLVGGTSASTPTMASIMALIEQKNGQYLGLPNPTFYKLAAAQTTASCDSSAETDPTQTNACVFHDITSGNNGAPGLPGYGTTTPDFTAGAGYDLASGLGSVNVANIVANWNSVTYAPSTTQLSATATTATHGQAIPITVTVSGAGAAKPTGDIAISAAQYGTEGQYTLGSSGTWTGNISDLPGGTYNLTARYAGDDVYASSTSTGVSLTISPENSVPALSVTVPNQQGQLVSVSGSQILGTPLYFKISAAGVSGNGIPTGAFNVLDGTTVVASGTLNAFGDALLSSQTLGVGSHSLTVAYAGDNSFNAATSAPTPVTIGKGEATTYPYIVSNVILGQPTILAVTVSGSGLTSPSGTVQFFDNGTAISAALPIVLNGPSGAGYSQATFTYTYTTAVRHTLSASYSGDSNYDSVAENDPNFAYSRTFTPNPVQGAANTLSVKMTTASTIQMGQVATFVAKVVPSSTSAQVPSGLVFIMGNGSIIGSVNLTNGQGTGSSYMDGAGVYQLSAQYLGDSNFLPSSANITGTLTVPQAVPVVSFTSSNPNVLTGTQTSLNYVASGIQINQYVVQDPTGTVTFADSVNGAASQIIGTYVLNQENGITGGFSTRANLPAGTNVLTATYSGNPNFTPVTSTLTVLVGTPDFTVAGTPASLQIAAGSSASTSLALSPVLGYTGTVALACTGGVPAGATCTVAPASVNLTSAQTATVTLATLAPSPTTTGAAVRPELWKITGGISLAAVLWVFLPRRRRVNLLAVLAAAALTTFSGCGGSSATPKATLIALTSSNIKAASGTSLTFTATLQALASNPAGTVTFYDGTTAIASNVPVAQGTATFQSSSLTVGGHVLKAVYSGDANDEPSNSTAITQVVTGTTTLQITASSGTLTHVISIPVTLD